MSCEEYAIFKTKRELENFIDDAPVAETNENFNRAEYLHENEPVAEPEPVVDNSFRPMDFANFSNQHWILKRREGRWINYGKWREDKRHDGSLAEVQGK